MRLTRLHIENLRNLVGNQIQQLGGGFNLFYGPNGSGKTSLLEAIHYLGMGRSFRSRQSKYVVHHNAEKLSVFGQLQGAINSSIGIERHKNGDYQYRIAGQNVLSSAELARVLPVQVIHPASHILLTGGPKQRRQFIDWGVFHVEHDFFFCWQRVEKALRQRNACLKAGAAKREIEVWDKELDVSASQLDSLRTSYLLKLEPVFKSVMGRFLAGVFIGFRYKRGWDHEQDFSLVLKQSLDRDLHQGFTQYGPQKADLVLTIEGAPIQDVLSQGQLKLVVYALRLAQGILLQQQLQKPCIYLLDDLPAELDEQKREIVIEVLAELKTQVFITAVEYEALMPALKLLDYQVFHVEHGIVTHAQV